MRPNQKTINRVGLGLFGLGFAGFFLGLWQTLSITGKPGAFVLERAHSDNVLLLETKEKPNPASAVPEENLSLTARQNPDHIDNRVKDTRFETAKPKINPPANGDFPTHNGQVSATETRSNAPAEADNSLNANAVVDAASQTQAPETSETKKITRRKRKSDDSYPSLPLSNSEPRDHGPF